MAKQTIGVGATPDDTTGSNPRAAGIIINSNFTELYNAALTSGAANKIYATPDGASGLPSIRSMVSADLPTTMTGKTLSGATLSGVALTRTTFTTNYTALTTDILLEYTGTTSSVTLSLPTAVGNGGRTYFIRNSGTTGVVTVDPNSTETLNGLATFCLFPNHGIQIASDGTNWVTLMRPVRQLISSTVCSNTASVDIVLPTTLLRNQFSSYELRLTSLLPATDNVSLFLRTSPNSGSSYNAGATDYSYVLNSQALAANAPTGATTTSLILANNIDNDSTFAGLNGNVIINDPLNPATRTAIITNIICRFSTDSTLRRITGGGERNATEANNGFQLLMSSGNIASGTVALYGVF